jgi:translation initiation factor IF-3
MVQFKGREMQHRDLGQQLLTHYLEQLASVATVESPTMVEGRTMFMLIAPKTKVAEKKKA